MVSDWEIAHSIFLKTIRDKPLGGRAGKKAVERSI